MAKIKLKFYAKKYKEDYNEYMLLNYNNAKEKYKKARQILIASFLFTIAFVLCFFWYVIIHCIDLAIILGIFCLIPLYLLYKAYSNQIKHCFCDIKLRQKNYEDMVSIRQYTEKYWMQPENQNHNYIKRIYDILCNDDYKILDMSVTYCQSENDYLLKIYYSVNDKVEIQKVLLLNQVTTEFNDFIISFINLSGWLFIPYEKRNELFPDVEYLADITELLSSK